MISNPVDLAKEAYTANRWRDALEHFHAADEQDELSGLDLEQFAISAILSGRDDLGAMLRERAHAFYLQSEDTVGAGRTALWLGITFMQKGEFAQAGGWIAKAQRLVGEQDCVEQGYLLLPKGLQASGSGDHETAIEAFNEATSVGERFRDRSLVALARHAAGRSLIDQGQIGDGLRLLDEAMIEVGSGEVNPIILGIVYCSLIDVCRRVFDIRRGREWTAALDRWSETQPPWTAFRGQCLVFRSEFKALAGEWTEALDEASAAAERLSEPPPHEAAGAAHYQQAELFRLLGDFDSAEASFTKAAELGHSVHPGLALLRLAQGRVEQAVGAVRRELEEDQDQLTRCRLLGPAVEIFLAAGALDEAESAVEELGSIAARMSSPQIEAIGAYAKGSTLLELGRAKEALPSLRSAQAGWRELGNPYEVARTSMLIAVACRAVGDEDTCELELRAARQALETLNALPALAKLRELSGEPKSAGGLTGREVEVLVHLAEGKTNRQIASELTISEKTVARHVANIFVKLGVSSRAAATAYAVKNRLT